MTEVSTDFSHSSRAPAPPPDPGPAVDEAEGRAASAPTSDHTATAGERAAAVADLVAAILEAGRVTRGLGEATNRMTGIRRSDYITLLRIQEFDRSRISDLAPGLELDVSVVSRKVAALDDLGLVTRTQDPDDGRAQIVSITDLGRETIAHNRRIYVESVRHLTAGWTTDDLATLAAGLHRLGSHRPEPVEPHTAGERR